MQASIQKHGIATNGINIIKKHKDLACWRLVGKVFDECEIKVIFVTITIPQLLSPSKMLLCAPTYFLSAGKYCTFNE
jgi:hypothetical protein